MNGSALEACRSTGPGRPTLPLGLQDRVAQLAVLRQFRTGQYLLRAGDAPRGMFGLVRGRTRHVYTVGEDREVLLHVGGPGLWTGEYPLISGARSINSVIADAPTAALYLSAKDWHRIVDEEPRWMRHFAGLLAERFAMAFRAYAEAQALSHDEWVYARLRLVAQIEREHGATTRRRSACHSRTWRACSACHARPSTPRWRTCNGAGWCG